jgi:hypothetical protein
MKLVTIKVGPAKDGDVVAANVILQQRVGSDWKDVERWNGIRGERKLLLDDNERLIVEGASDQAVVLDVAQGAAVYGRKP